MAKGKMDLSAFVGTLLEEQDGDTLREGIRVSSGAHRGLVDVRPESRCQPTSGRFTQPRPLFVRGTSRTRPRRGRRFRTQPDCVTLRFSLFPVPAPDWTERSGHEGHPAERRLRRQG